MAELTRAQFVIRTNFERVLDLGRDDFQKRLTFREGEVVRDSEPVEKMEARLFDDKLKSQIIEDWKKGYEG